MEQFSNREADHLYDSAKKRTHAYFLVALILLFLLLGIIWGWLKPFGLLNLLGLENAPAPEQFTGNQFQGPDDLVIYLGEGFLAAAKLDTDNDGIPDLQDPDDDNDGILDISDPDDNNDGVPDTNDPVSQFLAFITNATNTQTSSASTTGGTTPTQISNVYGDTTQVTYLDPFQLTSGLITNVHIRRHTIEAFNIDTNSITSRTIRNGTIVGNDISEDANLVINSLEVNDLREINNVSYAWPDTQGGAATVLTNDGSGTLSWDTLSGSSITPDSLDWSEFVDAMTVDATTTFNLDANNADLNFDANTFFIDASTNRIGIGTAAPGALLHVAGETQAEFFTVTDATGTSTFGQAVATFVPTQPHTFGTWAIDDPDANPEAASLVVNPASSVGDGNLIAAAVAGGVKFLVDAEGDVFVNSLTAVGSVTVGATNIASLTVEGQSNLGDSPTDLTLVSGSLGIRDTTPLYALTVGNGDLFGVNDSGAIAAATGITSSGTITFSGLTANRLVATDGSSNLVSTITAANLASSVTGTTGSGNLVFATAPTLTTLTVSSGGIAVTGNSTITGNLSSLTGLSSSGTITFSGLSAGGVVSAAAGTGTLSVGTLGASSITADSLDFTEFQDQLDLDASTDILADGTELLSITNSGTGNSFLVNDVAGDTSPFVIDASGSVGIGVTTASRTLHVGGTALVTGRFEVTGLGSETAALFARFGEVGTGLFFPSSNNIAITTNSSERLRILSTGQVGIGDTTPASLFTVGSGDLFQVDSNGDIVKLKNLTYSWPSSHTTNGVLTNNGSGTLTWATIGASGITADSLDFTEFQDQLDLDASTDILADGTELLSITNSGTGNSFLVNDEVGDTTPFVIDGAGQIGVGTTSLSDYLVSLSADTTGDYSRGLFISQANDATETSYGVYIDATPNLGSYNSTTTRQSIGAYARVTPTLSFATNLGTKFYEATGHSSDVRLGSLTYGNSSAGAHALVYGSQSTLSGSPTISDTDTGGTNTLSVYGSFGSASVSPTFSSTTDDFSANIYGGYFLNGSTTPDDALTTANLYGVYAQNFATAGTLGATTKYGGYFSTSGTADTNYGIYATVSGATNNYAGIFEGGNVGIGDTTPGQLLALATTSGDAAISFNALADDQSEANYSADITQNDTASAGWQDLANAGAEDQLDAFTSIRLATSPSDQLDLQDFGFDVPVGATITGIEVVVSRISQEEGLIQDLTVQLVQGGTPAGDNKADTATNWPEDEFTPVTYGDSTDLWGLTLTPADVNASDFGVVLAVQADQATPRDAQVDYITITVHYNHSVDYAAGIDSSSGNGAFKISGSSSLGTSDYLTVTSGGKVGIGDTTPDAQLTVGLVSTSTTARTEYGTHVSVADTGIVTVGNDTTYGSRVDLTRTGATGGTLTSYGQYINVLGDLAGSGNSINYGLYVTATGADTNYAAVFDEGQVGVGATPLFDSQLSVFADSTDDYSRALYISQTNDSAENSYGLYIDHAASLGTLTSSRNLYGSYTTLAPTVTAEHTFNPYSAYIFHNLGGVTLGDSDVEVPELGGAGMHIQVDGGPVYNDTEAGGSGVFLSVPAFSARTNLNPTLTSLAAGGIYVTYAGDFWNSSASSGNAGLVSTAYGIRVQNTGNLTTTGTTTKYGGHFTVSNTADTSYGLYVSVADATTNYAAIFEGGNVGIEDVTPDALLDFDFSSTSSTAGDEYGSYFTVSDSGVITTGTDNTYGNRISLSRSGATDGNTYNFGQYIDITDTTPNANGAATSYGTRIDITRSTAVSGSSTGVYGTYVDLDTSGAVTGGVTTGHYVDITGGSNMSTYGLSVTASGGYLNNGATIAVTSASPAGGTEIGLDLTVSDTGDTGTDTNYGSRINLTRSGNTSGTQTTYGQYISNTSTFASGSGTLNSYGLYIDSSSNSTGTSTAYGTYINTGTAGSANADTVYGLRIDTESNAGTAYGLYIDAGAGAGTEYSAIFLNGNVGIGDSSPDALFDLDATQTSGTLIGTAAPSSVTLAGTLIGADLNLRTNYTATNQSITGVQVQTPNTTNTGAGTYQQIGLVVGTSGATFAQSTAAGISSWAGSSVLIPALTQTTGVVTGIGYSATTSSITTGGNQYGFYVNASGVGAGNLYGVNISNITAGAGTERAVNIGTGWDYGIYSATTADNYFAGNVGIGDATPDTPFDIDTTRTTGTVFAMSAPSSTTLTGTLTGASLNLSTNYTITNQSLNGYVVTTAATTNTGAGTYLISGFSANGGALTQNTGAGTTGFTGFGATNSNITQTTGTVSSIGFSSTTGTITTGGSQIGFFASTAGVGAGNLYGFLAASITGGAGTEYGLLVGSGYDFGFSVASKSAIQTDIASNYALTIFNDGNNANRFGLIVQAGADSAGTGTLIQFTDGDGTDVGEITFSGTTTTYSTSSDERLKKNIRPTEYGLVELMQIEVSDYEFRTDDMTSTGFIAQQLRDIYPYPVVVPADGGYWSVDYGRITPLLVRSIQDQQALIEFQRSDLDRVDSTVTETTNTTIDLNEELASLLERLENIETNIEDLQNQITALEGSGGNSNEEGIFENGVSVTGLGIFNSIVSFMDQVAFEGVAEFKGGALFNTFLSVSKDTAGVATITTGNTSIEVTFEEAYDTLPVVTVTPKNFVAEGAYRVTSESTTGFTIEMEVAPAEEMEFSWIALQPQE